MQGPRKSGSFARSFDTFVYKRIKDTVAAEFTDASRLGASISLCGGLVMVVLFVLELLAYLTVQSRSDVVMAPASSEPVRLTFNITFPRLPCQMVELDLADSLGTLQHNLTANIVKYKVDTATGRALMLVQDGRDKKDVQYGPLEGDFLAEQSPVALLDVATFSDFVTGFDVALVAYGAPWCPWSRRLLPVLEEIGGIVGHNSDVRIGRVDCTDPAAAPLCGQAHINAYPSIILYKGRKSTHSDLHYHGDRTPEALLSFLVVAQQDTDLASGDHRWVAVAALWLGCSCRFRQIRLSLYSIVGATFLLHAAPRGTFTGRSCSASWGCCPLWRR